MKKIALVPLLLILSLSAQAGIDNVARTARDLGKRLFSDNVKTTENVRVMTARVATADYDLIARDFPLQAPRAGESNKAWKDRVDAWIVQQVGFIGIEQSQQTVVNTEIQTGPETKKSFRPKAYNRAFVMPVEGGLIDAKGVGSLTPRQRDHGNGLATLGEGIREFIYEKLVSRIFKHSGIDAKTVGTYAVLDYGFDVIHADGSKDRAGMILRQAHRRSSGHISLLDIDRIKMIEKTLRSYGLTSSGESASGKMAFGDYINIQGTDNPQTAEVIDFGAYFATEKFERNTVSPYDITQIIWSPLSEDFQQPNAHLRVSLEQWGDFGTHDPKADRPWVWSHELAKAFAEGRADRQAFEAHLQNMLGGFEAKLNKNYGSCHLFFL